MPGGEAGRWGHAYRCMWEVTLGFKVGLSTCLGNEEETTGMERGLLCKQKHEMHGPCLCELTGYWRLLEETEITRQLQHHGLQ